MPRLTPTTTQTCSLSAFTPRPTLQLCHVHQEKLYYLQHGGFILSATPRAALRSHRLSLPLSSGHDTCLSALPDPTVSLTETACLTSFQFSCKVYLWRDVVVKLKKALACTTGSRVLLSACSPAGKEESTYKMAPGSERESSNKAALGTYLTSIEKDAGSAEFESTQCIFCVTSVLNY